MAIATRVALVLAAFATSLAAAACGGDDDAAESTTSQSTGAQIADTTAADAGMRLTLTDSGCTYEGPPSVESGVFTAEGVNETTHFGAFAVGGIAEGSTLDDLAADVAEVQRAFEETGALPEPPAYFTQAVRSGVEAGQTGFLPADVPAGTYALMCFVDAPPIWRAYVAGGLEVTG